MQYLPKILIVEDEPTLSNSLKGFLSRQASQVTLAHSGKEAMESLADNSFDLILLDMVLPDMGGDQIMDYVNNRELESLIIVMTGYASTESAIDSLRKGAHDYLKKPFDLEDLSKTIENALNRKSLEDARRRAEQALQQAHTELEKRVEDRTSELTEANERLRQEIEKRTIVEAELRRAHDELEVRVVKRTAELAEANEVLRVEIAERRKAEDALRNSSEKLKSFAYSVIHDLKSPAVGIYGLTKLLRKHYKDLLDEKGKDYCDQILRATEHVAALIEKINVYISTKEAPLAVEVIGVDELLQIVRDEFSARLAIREIEWLAPETMPEIKADRLCMLRVFRNLVDNALKHGGDDLSQIRIAYGESEESHIFSVSDDGVGIESGDFEGIFVAFSRQETSKAVEGVGLGLAIVREIAERHGGHVWAELRESGGVTFRVSALKGL